MATGGERRVNGAIAALTVAAIAALAVGTAALADFSLFGESENIERKPLGSCNAYEFDRSEWENTHNANRSDPSDPGDPSPAQLQARQLIACRSLEGATREQLLRQLGDPDFPRAHPMNARWFSFFIGISPTAALLEGESLSVRFAKTGRVDQVTISEG